MLLDRPYWTNEDILAALDNVEMDAILNFGNLSLLRNMSLVCLGHGSTTDESVSQDMCVCMLHVSVCERCVWVGLCVRV